MRTSVEPLEGHKVKLSVEVDEEELRRDEADTLARLSREVSLPGFRPGRVPQRLIEHRLGTKGLRQEVLRDALPRYLGEAVDEQDLDVISQPEVEVRAGEEGGPVSFDAVIEVRPEVEIPGYAGLSVTVPPLEPTDADVEAQIDRMREQFASLNVVERAVQSGDVVTIDVHSTRDEAPVDNLSVDDFVYEVGSEGIVPGLDEKLVDAEVGATVELDAEDAPGGPVHVAVTVKQVQEKVLPEANDEFASDASEFDTLAELSDDVRHRLAERRLLEVNSQLREGAIEALSDLVAEEPPAALVEPETQGLLHDFAHRLAAQRVRIEDYLAAIGQAPDDFVAELRTQATRQVKADLALRALAQAESIEVDETDVDEELVRLASQSNTTPGALRDALERDGRLTELRSQLRKAKALRWLVEHVAVVDEEGKPVDRSALVVETEEATPASVGGVDE
jgi:trigger factor